MKLILFVALIATLTLHVNAACSEIANCDSCTNPAVLCDVCPVNTVKSEDKTKCLDCGTACIECEADKDDKVTCNKCTIGHYLEKGECVACTEGCETCHKNTTLDKVVCDKCYAAGYVQDTSVDTADCIKCPSNCKKCKLNTDKTTTCSECYSYAGLAIRGYYLAKKDSSCKSCPSFCEKCTENTNAVALCDTCFKDYLPLVDENDSTKSKTKCVKCPSECSTCTGVEVSSRAFCSACKDGLGNYNDKSGSCTQCDANCLSCSDEGKCTTCKEAYRVESGACTACPAFCNKCTLNEETSVVSCDTCKASYGTKEAKYKTCDVCTTPNCATCTRGSDGSMTCSTCKDNYGKGSDGKCTACPTGCKTCEYSTDHIKCTSCQTGFTATVKPLAGSSTALAPSVCKACKTNCKTCDWAASDTVCQTCTDDKTHYVDSSKTPAECSALPANCKTAAVGVCTVCKDGFYNSSFTCAACPSALSCKTCKDTTRCTSCNDGFGLIDKDLDNTTETCDSCGISNCKRCFSEIGNSNFPQKCWQCKTGYVLYDQTTKSTLVGSKCQKCPTGCDTCTVEYGTGSAFTTKCKADGCTAWNGKIAYTAGTTGTCVQCPSNCKVCTYDSTSSTTKCSDNQCNTKYAKNANGECEACPANCLSCEYNADKSAIVCKDGQCESKYGKNSEGTCSACPSSCVACELSGTKDDTILYCKTCASGYVLNEDVCGACPSNCETCDNKDGSMICTKCKVLYALDSAKACVKCAANCKKCSATKCTECDSGYGLSADQASCVACGTAAFDNCMLCGGIDSATKKAPCNKCTSGYVLKDGKTNSSCVDASSLSCGKGSYKDKPAECGTCSSGYDVTKDLLCAKTCFSCGDVATGAFVAQTSCVIPEEGSNSTSENNAKLIPCFNGVCYAAYQDGKVMAGCMPSGMSACSDEQLAGETCRDIQEVKRCERCCTDNKCNKFVSKLDGVPDSAMLYAANAILLLAASVLALFI